VTHIAEPADVRQTRIRAGLVNERREAREAAGEVGNVFSLDLRIDAPRRIFLRGRGLDAELGGSFTVGGTTRVPAPVGGIGLASSLLTDLEETGADDGVRRAAFGRIDGDQRVDAEDVGRVRDGRKDVAGPLVRGEELGGRHRQDAGSTAHIQDAGPAPPSSPCSSPPAP